MLGVGGDVGYGGCEPRVEGIVQGTKRYCTILRRGGSGSGWGGGLAGGGVRVDVKEEKNLGGGSWFGRGGGGVVGGQGGCERRIKFFFGGVGVGGGGWGGVRVDMKAMLGVGGDVGYGGCEPRVEGIVQGTKRYCTILRKLKKNVRGGRGRGNI